MATEARGEFHRALERLDIAVGSLLVLIPEAVQTATAALLGADGEAAGVEGWRRSVEELYADVEHTIEVVVARQAPVAGDLRFLLACIRLVPALQEVVDLVADVAGAGPDGVSPPASGSLVASLVASLGDGTASVWTAVGSLWSERDPALQEEVRAGAARVAAIRSALGEELAAGAVGLSEALRLAVAAQAFERLARQALHDARLIAPLTGAWVQGGWHGPAMS